MNLMIKYMGEIIMNKYGKLMTVKELKETDEESLMYELNRFVESELDLPVKDSQKKSWIECIEYMKRTFSKTDVYDNMWLLFEYCIPLSCYRRPDVILFFKNTVLVLEFKRKSISLQVDKDQLRGYLNQIRNYHQKTHEYKLDIKGALVVTEAIDKNFNEKGITLIALVVTIIILIILAGISISTLTGKNGILSRATEAQNLTRISNEKEALELAYTLASMENSLDSSNQYFIGKKLSNPKLDNVNWDMIVINDSQKKYGDSWNFIAKNTDIKIARALITF